MAAEGYTMKNIIHNVEPILQAKGLMKRYGTVVAMNGADFDLYPNEAVSYTHLTLPTTPYV